MILELLIFSSGCGFGIIVSYIAMWESIYKLGYKEGFEIGEFCGKRNLLKLITGKKQEDL